MPDQPDATRFLTALYEQAKQDNESPEEVAKRVYQNARGVSRRELLQAGGALGVGGVLGGGGIAAATQTAAADASTSDSDGNMGTPSDPVDAFVDGIDIFDGPNNQIGSLDETGLEIPSLSADAINSDEVWSSWGDIYPATDDGVDQAIADLNAETTSGAWIRVPPGFFTVSTPWVADNHKAIFGWDGSRDKTQIEAGSGHSGPMVDIRGTHYLRDIRLDAKSNVQVATDAAGSGDAAFVAYNNANFAGSSVYPEYEITNVNAFRWSWFNSEVRNGFRFGGSFQNDFFACTFLAPGSAGDYAIHLDGTNQATIWGGNVKTGGSDEAAIFVDNSNGRVQDVEFRGVDVEWFADSSKSAPAYQLGAAGASNNIHWMIDGGQLRNTNFSQTNYGTAVVINGAQGAQFRPTSIDHAATGVEVHTGEAKFQNGEFGPWNPHYVGSAYSGFSSNPVAQDKRLVGGSFTTS